MAKQAQRLVPGRTKTGSEEDLDTLAKQDDEVDTLHRIENEIIAYLKRVYYFAKRLAKAVAEAEMAGLSGEAKEALEEVMAP